ncbi:related to transcriptional regulator rds2 [Sporisorium reilianum SRZ2]|uniref:Transcription activator of gluconeogenesis ERT1 n=1 Tax=Sporisorium reilianum (strain SRZ2) TaxID=999809 RepID=E6ZY52_SPORE|nr:related to transcriptional regulator rds2 [Sporisorium reilianum SRZ2]
MSSANGSKPSPRPPAAATPTYSLPPHPSTTNAQRQQSPASHAAASTLAALATSPPSSSSAPSPRPLHASAPSSSSSATPYNARTSTASMLNQSLYSNASSTTSKAAAKSPSGSPLKKQIDLSTKASPASPSVSTPNKPASSSSAGTPTSSKRKKANRACLHCQKAHLTCDDSRPCQRCVKKGLAESCMDGHRKKAKYLLDDDELEQLRRQKEAKKAAKQAAQQKSNPASQQPQPRQSQTPQRESSSTAQQPSAPSPEKASAVTSILDHVTAGIPTPSSSGHGPSPHQHDYLSSNPFESSNGGDPPSSTNNGGAPFDLSFDPSPHNFGSEATSLEYSILSSMLNGTDLQLLGPSGSPDFQTSPAVGVMDGWNIASGGLDAILNLGLRQDQAPGAGGMDTAAATYSDTAGMGVYAEPQPSTGLQEVGGEGAFNALEVPSPKPTMMEEPTLLAGGGDEAQQAANVGTSSGGGNNNNNNNNNNQIDLGSSSQRSASNEPVADINKAIASRRVARQQQDTIWRARIAKTYRDNTAPFPYPEGYHFLVKYVTSKFEKQDVLRIVRALAIFRPSLIALQMPLTEEDEIFVERSFQRTMLEFEKLISFSGTPTVVWRRTCEICVVGAEFCMLTQWSKDQLMGRRIYEFMDKNSTLDYWEKFAQHAFENTTQSVMTTCTLVKPDGKLVPCAWSFTIKRDIFDLPSLVVGNFLPILS